MSIAQVCPRFRFSDESNEESRKSVNRAPSNAAARETARQKVRELNLGRSELPAEERDKIIEDLRSLSVGTDTGARELMKDIRRPSA